MNRVKITKDALDDVFKCFKSLTKSQVLVGVPDANADRKPEAGEAKEPTNATIAYVHEFGSPARNIPARPFLLPGIRAAREDIVKQMRKGAETALNGKLDDIDKCFHAVGLTAQNHIRARITDGPFAPLSPRTLSERKAKGRTSEKPLIDTGQLRAAVTYVITDKTSENK